MRGLLRRLVAIMNDIIAPNVEMGIARTHPTLVSNCLERKMSNISLYRESPRLSRRTQKQSSPKVNGVVVVVRFVSFSGYLHYSTSIVRNKGIGQGKRNSEPDKAGPSHHTFSRPV